MIKLIEWKKSTRRKPMLLCGARQVGKTWLMKEFGRQNFRHTLYINFDVDTAIRRIFDDSLDITRIISLLQTKCDFTITPENTLIIFDEIQEAPRALTCLKYFCENAPEYAVIAAGSLLGVAMHPETNFPVGKVELLNLYPLTYTEFLTATGNERFVDLLAKHDWQAITVFKSTYIDLLKKYYVVGGMPEAVATYIDSGNFVDARTIHQQILSTYEQDFSKHAPPIHSPRIRMVWDSIPSQLSKENRKFLYNSVMDSSRAKDFELAIQWLKDCGLITKVHRVTKPELPLLAYQDMNVFKMFMLDVGILVTKSNLSPEVILDGNRIFTEFKGALTEQYVLQQLVAECKITPHYWANTNSLAEIDFIFQTATDVIPVEVKAETNLKAKSLQSYCRKYQPPLAVRCSMADYMLQPANVDDYHYTLLNLPLYAVNHLSLLRR